jgi:hypothetical protein
MVDLMGGTHNRQIYHSRSELEEEEAFLGEFETFELLGRKENQIKSDTPQPYCSGICTDHQRKGRNMSFERVAVAWLARGKPDGGNFSDDDC